MSNVSIFSLIVLSLIPTSDTHKATDGKIIFQSDLKLIDPVICLYVNYFFSLGEVNNLGELLITLREVDKDGNVSDSVTIVDRIPLRKELTLNWNHYERTIRYHEAQLFIISVVQTQSADSQATAVLLDVSFDKNICPAESLTIESTVPTTSVTDYLPCCIEEPCICVYSDSMVPSSLIVSSFVEPSFGEINIKSIDNGPTTTKNHKIHDNSMIPKTQINEITKVPHEYNSNINEITSTMSNQLTTIINFPSESVINFNQLSTTNPSNDNEPVTESTLYSTTTLVTQMIKENASSQLTTDDTPQTTELIQPTSTDNQLINSSVITVDEIINQDAVNTIKIANLGYNLFLQFKLLIKQRFLIFSISGLGGLIFLVICVTIVVLTQHQQEDPKFNLVPATGLELNTITFHRRTINSNILQILSDYRKCNVSADLTF